MDWVNVKDRLPADSHQVMFFAKDIRNTKQIMVGYIMNGIWHERYQISARNVADYIDVELKSDLVEVTHWMELPTYPDIRMVDAESDTMKHDCLTVTADLSDSTHADYVYKEVGVLLIFDLNRGNKSVTNDVEHVLAELKQKGLIYPGRRIFYRDSDGIFDEIKINEDGKFIGFAPISTQEWTSYC